MSNPMSPGINPGTSLRARRVVLFLVLVVVVGLTTWGGYRLRKKRHQAALALNVPGATVSPLPIAISGAKEATPPAAPPVVVTPPPPKAVDPVAVTPPPPKVVAPAPAPAPVVPAENLAMYLPPKVYAVAGHEMSIYYENLVDVKDINRYAFSIKCAFGTCVRRKWTCVPTDAQVGDHPLELVVADEKGNVLGTAATTLHVSPKDSGKGHEFRLLIVGDSLTHSTHYVNELDRLLEQPGNPHCVFYGTNRVSWARPGVGHEGFSGWTYFDFLHYYDIGTKTPRTRDHSPFLYAGKNGAPVLDVPRYLRENCTDGPPDLIIFQLGINDVFSPDLKGIVANARLLLAAFRFAAPKAALAVWLTQPVNLHQPAFDHYGPSFPRSLIKSRQHQLVQELVKEFGNCKNEGIFVIPMNLNLDPVDDFPVFDAVHPTLDGYTHLGQAVYAWIKNWIETRGDLTKLVAP